MTLLLVGGKGGVGGCLLLLVACQWIDIISFLELHFTRGGKKMSLFFLGVLEVYFTGKRGWELITLISFRFDESHPVVPASSAPFSHAYPRRRNQRS